MNDSLFIAVDLGAGSGRVFLAGVASGEVMLEETRRFHYPATESAGRIRWNLPEIFDQIKMGLHSAGERARKLGRRIRSLGVDSWGVDYGLTDANNQLLELPVSYRDRRTEKTMEQVFARLPRSEIFKRTGIQLLPFNTLFQLYASTESGIGSNSAHLLMIPDLINCFLTGETVTEYTNATTTQLVNASSRTWDLAIIEPLGLPSHLLSKIVPAGTDIGPLTPALTGELQLNGVRVVAPATHDTASAVAGAPLEEGWAYISSGTWSLVGVELKEVLINDEVARLNFTNEGGAFGTNRFLKNVMGLWLLESCRKEWQARHMSVDYDELLSKVAAGRENGDSRLIFPDDPRFFNPPSMLAAISAQLAESEQQLPESPPAIAKLILDSLALRYASVCKSIESLTGRKIPGLHIVGGGSLNDYLNQVTADVTGLNVIAGPSEATVIGNALVQAITAGRFESLAAARAHVRRNMKLKEFIPRPSPQRATALRQYQSLEDRYGN